MLLLPLLSVVWASNGKAEAASREGLVLEYRFEENVLDSSGHGHQGIVQGQPGYVDGQEGKCLAFDGDGDYIDSGTNLPGLTETFTVECWVRPEATQKAYADLWGNHAGSPFGGFVLQQNGDQTNQYYFAYGTGQAWIYSRTIGLTPGEWQHVAVVKTPTRLRLYLNGMLVDRRAADQPMAVSSTPFLVGKGIAGEGRYFRGLIDEVRVWDRERTFEPFMPPEQQLEWFEKTARLETEATVARNIFRAGDPKEITFFVDPETVPAIIDTISVSLECRDAEGHRTPFASPLTLRRSTGFRQSVAIPTKSGYYQVSCALSVRPGRRSGSRAGGTFSFAVLPDWGSSAKVSSAQRGHVNRMKAGKDGIWSAEASALAVLSTAVVSLDGEWLLATDPQNVGREQKWFAGPVPEAKPTKVPWIIQDAFPGYHGVAWYWRDFVPPASPHAEGRTEPTNQLTNQPTAHPHAEGRTLLRFWAVDYLAEVWLNGVPVGGHEGGETPFVLDVTDTLKPNATNRLAVRVLNPTHEPIDGIVLNQTPRRAKVIPYGAGASYNHGGIVDSVELVIAPAVRVEDLFVWPDPQTGTVHVRANVRNARKKTVRGRMEFTVAPAASGETLDGVGLERELPPGDTLVEAQLQVPHPHLWDLNDPYLYRVTARVWTAPSGISLRRGKKTVSPSPPYEGGAGGGDERSVRCGFRDFRFANGYFRLNGRRLFIRSSHTVNAAPVGQQVPADPDLFRRDLLYVKAMGFNAIRFIWGGATRYQLDLCDEIGLLVYEESYASQPLEDSPQMAERFDRSVAELIRRDRNHPSVVMWGLLNESSDNPAFRHAVGMLPLVRFLDDTRVVMLNSGRYDRGPEIGSLSNPGSSGWEDVLSDQHHYPRVPHTADTIRTLRTLNGGKNPAFLTEYGIGSAVDLWRVTRHFEQLGQESAEDAQFYRARLDRFLADWERWNLADCFARPEDFFAQSLRKMAGQRTLGLNAIRANPNLVGYSLTGTMDHVNCGEGLFTLFRELKPGTVDALFDGLAPLRWCLFVEPVNVYRGTSVRLEAVLANEDALPPGEYPVRLQVIGPHATRVFERTITVTIPPFVVPPSGGPSLVVPPSGGPPLVVPPSGGPMVLPIFAEDVPIDGPSGKYRFLATFERGAAATGGETEFYVADPADLPPVEAEVVLWGEDPGLAKWLADHGIRVRSVSPPYEGGAGGSEKPTAREVILVSQKPLAPGGVEEWRELARRIACGSTAVFLAPEVFVRGDQPLGWLPLANKGTPTAIVGWLYLKDEWAKNHPIFDGLPSGGLMDYTFYREIIPDAVWSGQDPPAEAVAGAIKASQDYSSGLMVSVYPLSAGRFILNTLHIRENLGRHPAADRLLVNLLRYAARDADLPRADRPPDWEEQLGTMGY